MYKESWFVAGRGLRRGGSAHGGGGLRRFILHGEVDAGLGAVYYLRRQKTAKS